jgi:hypothetical protein
MRMRKKIAWVLFFVIYLSVLIVGFGAAMWWIAVKAVSDP